MLNLVVSTPFSSLLAGLCPGVTVVVCGHRHEIPCRAGALSFVAMPISGLSWEQRTILQQSDATGYNAASKVALATSIPKLAGLAWPISTAPPFHSLPTVVRFRTG